jgi:hypothetical protein
MPGVLFPPFAMISCLTSMPGAKFLIWQEAETFTRDYKTGSKFRCCVFLVSIKGYAIGRRWMKGLSAVVSFVGLPPPAVERIILEHKRTRQRVFSTWSQRDMEYMGIIV